MPELSPLRPAEPLAVPPGALDQVVRRGAQRRRRGLAAAAGGAASVVLAGALLVAGGGGPVYDSLTPADTPSATPTSSAGPVPGALPRATALPLVSALPLPGRPSASPTPTTKPDPSVQPQPEGTAQERVITVAEPQTVPVDDVCKTPSPYDPSGWCQYVTVPDEPRTGSTTTITLSVCLDAYALPADLRFPAGPELRSSVYIQPENAQYDPADDARYLFRARSQSVAAHVRHLNPGFCLRWTLPWKVVDEKGKALPACEPVTVAALSEASELSDFPFGEEYFYPGRTDGVRCNRPAVVP